ncbi:unnamed protein product [Lepeophtheirus salmonis]|uniref:(salmon louse) hypothetical protein n=1 Tax=Lepeophtheirus salmonis TaxID=72036 RepID=A0A7R8CEX6_LEPSM|nr:unnamed protein product [Lepeophtheirus salmonis]CAF2795684.1 unnamed protein product [Lepeophtheirus salmonis]
MTLLDTVNSEDEEDLDSLVCDSDTEFEYVDEAVQNAIENDQDMSVSEFVIWFLDFDELFRLIVKESMRYAQQKGVSFVVTTEEIKVFHGIILGMNLMVLPSIKDYWCTDQFGVDWIKTTMPRDSSVNLVQQLKERGIYFTGTISEERKGPPEFIPDKELRKTTASMDPFVNVNAGFWRP